ncbi:hypothetical protein CDD83_4585 [Cordyceps sp. RAO-2017]|nr:hypothetical protein CDD83_4585 [Cordyceps sp. RAO-2017]
MLEYFTQDATPRCSQPYGRFLAAGPWLRSCIAIATGSMHGVADPCEPATPTHGRRLCTHGRRLCSPSILPPLLHRIIIIIIISLPSLSPLAKSSVNHGSLRRTALPLFASLPPPPPPPHRPPSSRLLLVRLRVR